MITVMPPRSTVYTLPEPVREALDRRIIAAGFGRYADHAAWLAGQGHAISLAALQRYGRRLRDGVERDRAGAREAAATMTARIHRSNEMARAIDEATDDDPLALPERAVGMCLLRICEAATEEDIDPRTLQAAGRLLNDCLRAWSSSGPSGKRRGNGPCEHRGEGQVRTGDGDSARKSRPRSARRSKASRKSATAPRKISTAGSGMNGSGRTIPTTPRDGPGDRPPPAPTKKRR